MNKTTSNEQDAAALLLKEEQVSHAVLGLFKAPFCPSNKLLQKFIKLPRAASREQSTDKAEHVSDTTFKLPSSVSSTPETSSEVMPAGIPAGMTWDEVSGIHLEVVHNTLSLGITRAQSSDEASNPRVASSIPSDKIFVQFYLVATC